MIRFAFCLALAGDLASVVLSSAYAGTYCNPAIPRDDDRPVGYKERESSRCEGVYRRQVSSYGFQILSLVSTPDQVDLCGTDQPVSLVWAPRSSAQASVQLSAESIRSHLFYRLDTRFDDTASSFAWPRDPRCSSEVRLRADELALVVRQTMRIGSRSVDVLLPVVVRTGAALAPRPPYHLTMVPGRRVSEVWSSLWYHGDGTSAPTRVRIEEALGRAPYPQGLPIAIHIPAEVLREQGIYRLQVNVQFDGGQPPLESRDVYFSHAG